MPEKKLFLLDAFALIYRAYYAFIKNPRINSKGLNTSAMLGFTNTLHEVLNKQKPTHIAVVFDTPEETGRSEAFADYKANRQAMPEDIALSIPYIKRIIEAFNIPILEAPGYEADDVIGTLAKKAEKKGFSTYMMTPDKDFGQLVSDNIFMYKPARFGNEAEILGVKEICQKFEIDEPLQVIDILGLMGDAVDNIPGIPGVGEKTAKKLIGQYGSVEKLLESTGELKGKLKENVEGNMEQALLSKQLATILLDAPVDLDEKELEVSEINKDRLTALFTELEFQQLARRILGEEIEIKYRKAATTNGQPDLFSSLEDTEDGPPSDKKDITNTNHTYKLVGSEKERRELIGNLRKQKSFCFDTETTGLNPQIAELVGLSFCWQASQAFYVPVPENQDEARVMVAEFKELLEDERIEKIGQNIKYDISILKRYGIEVGGKMFDTMIAHYLIQPDQNRRNMDVLADTFLNYKPVSIETLIGKKGSKQASMRTVPIEELVNYASEDADITLQLKEEFEPLLTKTKTRKLFDEIETPLVPVLASMEAEGIALDTKVLAGLSKELVTDILKAEKEIYKLAGADFNIASPRQVGEILFDRLKVSDKPKKTKTGQYATGEDVLTKLANAHPVIGKILDFRELQKLRNTYVEPLPTLINPITGKIHTSYNQVVTSTGRLSSDNPNLQNIPIRTERGREIRKAFVPRNNDFTLLSADYSQIELRIIAELSQDASMIDAFVKGQDIHAATAARVFNTPIEDVTREMRGKAKAVNFGISYGQTAFGLAQTLNISRTEAHEIIDNFFSQYAGLKKYMDESIARARKNGYVETMMGRKRYLRDINSANAVVRSHAERNAINAPIQGSAADMIKIAMINIYREFEKRKFQSRMLLQVHDELVFDVYKKEVDNVISVVENEMKNAIKMEVPIEVEMDTGNNWLEAH